MGKNLIKLYYGKYRRHFKNASIYFFASIFAAGLKILINPIMAKNLTHEDYAIIGYFGSFSLLFLPFLTFMVFAYYQRNYYLVSDEKRKQIGNTIIIFLAGIGAISSSILLVGQYIYFKISHVNFPFLPFAFYSIYQMVLNNFLTFLQVNYRLRGEATRFAWVTILSSFLWLAISVFLVVVLKLGAHGSMGANLIVSLILAVYAVKITLSRFEFSKAILKSLLKFCWPLALSSLFWYFLSGVDVALLEKLDDTKNLALYNIALSLSGALFMVYNAVNQTFEPDIYKAIAEKKLNRMIKIIGIIISINVITVIFFILFATPLTRLFTADRYTDAASFAQVLSLKNVTMGLYFNVLTIIVGFGFTKADLSLRAIGALFSIVMFTLLIKYYKFNGAAWGQVLSFFLMTIIGVLYILQKNKKGQLFSNTN